MVIPVVVTLFMTPVTKSHDPASGPKSSQDIEEWSNEVDEVTSQIRGIIDGTRAK